MTYIQVFIRNHSLLPSLQQKIFLGKKYQNQYQKKNSKNFWNKYGYIELKPKP